jgi:hypothetical protein
MLGHNFMNFLFLLPQRLEDNIFTMRFLQFSNAFQNVLRIGFVSHIEQRQLQFSAKKILNFKQTVRQINFRSYNSMAKNHCDDFDSLSTSKDSNVNENDAVISTFDLFSIGIGPSSRFVRSHHIYIKSSVHIL